MRCVTGESKDHGYPDEVLIEHAALLISEADSLIIAAGAGIGVDSGLPDFRGDAGFWKEYPALAADGTSFAESLHRRLFAANPVRAWGFYGHRLNLYRNTAPHAGFGLLREWGRAKERGYFVFTSNVDSQVHTAGFDSRCIDECHGSIHEMQCLLPCSPAVWSANAFEPEVDMSHCELVSPLPTCPHCGGGARPNILMFNQ